MTKVEAYIEERRRYLYQESTDIREQSRMWAALSSDEKKASEPLYFEMYHKWATASPDHPRNKRR